MLLPIPSNRALLRSFWLNSSLIVGVLAAGLSSLFGGMQPWTAVAVGGAVALLMAVPGLLFPYAVALPYRGWNWVVRRLSAVAVRYVAWVCFWTVGLAFARVGTADRFERSPSGSSMWRSRGTQPVQAYSSEHLDGTGTDRGNGFQSLQAWMRASGPRFGWTLLPFLRLIRFVNAGSVKDDEESANIYTLY